MGQMQSEEDSNEGSLEEDDKEDQELPANPVHVEPTPVESNHDPDETDHVAAMTGSGANLEVSEEFGYENFHIVNYHSGISAADPVARELRQQYLDADDCLNHIWPAEFRILQSHAVARALPLLQSQITYSEWANSCLTQGDIEWILLQSAWLSVYMDVPAAEMVQELLQVSLVATEKGQVVSETMHSTIQELLQAHEVDKAISVVALYPAILKVLQSMLDKDFLRTTEANAPSSTSGQREKPWQQELQDLSMAELQHFAVEAEGLHDAL